MSEEHLIFENPEPAILLKHGIIQVDGGVKFKMYPTVLENVHALIDMIKMRPRKGFVGFIVEMSSWFIYGCADFSLTTLSKIFCQGLHGFSPGSQISNTVAHAQWIRGTMLGLQATFTASPSIAEIINEIFEKKL